MVAAILRPLRSQTARSLRKMAQIARRVEPNMLLTSPKLIRNRATAQDDRCQHHQRQRISRENRCVAPHPIGIQIEVVESVLQQDNRIVNRKNLRENLHDGCSEGQRAKRTTDKKEGDRGPKGQTGERLSLLN